jgi:hypothetical protein
MTAKSCVMRFGFVSALMACGSASKSERATQAPVTAPAAQPQREWWCISFNNDMNGLCLAARSGCEAMLADLRRSSTDPNEQLGDCRRQANPVCFDKTAGGREKQVCHPSFSTCRSHADHMKSKGDTITECRSLDANAAQNPNWWCVAYERGGVGSCSRSLADCEAGRDFLRRRLPNETLECSAQQTATCFELADEQGKATALCQPNVAICNSTLAKIRDDKTKKSVGDCHSVE